MKQLKFLLTGKDGQVGFELQRSLAVLGEIVAVGRSECDLTDITAVRELVARVKPDVIVNPAAYTAVDKAETETVLARIVNTQVPQVLGEEANRHGALVIHYSTDYIFDGELNRPYIETDAPNPQSVYGHTKYAGEQALMAATPRHLILRTSWVAGAHGQNFAKTMLRLAMERDHLCVVADQQGSPTSAALLADLTAHVIQQWRDKPGNFPYGLYHCTTEGEVSWYDYARFVIEKAGQAGKPIRVLPTDIEPISTDAYPLPAKRPANSRLNCQRFKDTFQLELPHWQSGISHLLEQIL